MDISDEQLIEHGYEPKIIWANNEPKTLWVCGGETVDNRPDAKVMVPLNRVFLITFRHGHVPEITIED